MTTKGGAAYPTSQRGEVTSKLVANSMLLLELCQCVVATSDYFRSSFFVRIFWSSCRFRSSLA